MRLWLMMMACLAAIVLLLTPIAPVNAQQCQNGICQIGQPLIAAPGPVFGGPVFLTPATHQHAAIVPLNATVCDSGQCVPAAPVILCAPPPCAGPHCGYFRGHTTRSGGFGIGLNVSWNRRTYGGYVNRWH